MASGRNWTYFVMLGVRSGKTLETYAECGPLQTSTEAVEYGMRQVGKSVGRFRRFAAKSNFAVGVQELVSVPRERGCIVGYTVERYDADAEETDGHWHLDGGIRWSAPSKA